MAIFVASPLVRAWAPTFGLLIVQVAALCVFTAAAPLGAGFPLDDAWIHQLVARTFAETGAFGVDPNRFASGASSLSWPFLLALNPALFDAPEAAFAEALNVVLYLVSGQVFLGILRRDGMSLLPAFAAASLAALSGNFLWFAFSGMEATLLATLILGAIAAWARPEPTLRSALVAGALLALAALTRPEAVVFAGIVALSFWWVRRPVQHAVACALPCVIAFSLYLASTAGGPSTVAGRRWMFLAYGQGLGRSEFAAEFLLRWAERLATYSLGLSRPEWFWPLAGLGLVGIALVLARGQRGFTLAIALTAAHVLVYAVSMPTEGHGGRYQPLVPFLFLPLVFMGASSVLRAVLERFGRVPPAAMAPVAFTVSAVLLAGPACAALSRWGTDHAVSIRHVRDTEVRMGRHLDGLPPAARIASFDLGGIGYFSRRKLLDLGALVEPEVLSLIRRGRTDELLIERRIEYVIVPMGYSEEFPDPWNFSHRLNLGASRRFSLERVTEFASEPAVWVPGLEATLHCSPRQVLYRIRQ